MTDLARKYGIVTPYTAYLIVEDEQRRDIPVQMRSLEQLERDDTARREAAQSWHQFTTESGGDAGVAGALSGMALKSADAAAPASLGAQVQFGRRYGLVSTAGGNGPVANIAEPKDRVAQYTQQTQFAAGKNFFQNGSQWVDTAVQKMAKATPVRIQFGSPQYFELLSKSPPVASWLALGQNVQFVWNNTLYEIYE